MTENKKNSKVTIKVGDGNGKIYVSADKAEIKTGKGNFQIKADVKDLKIEKSE